MIAPLIWLVAAPPPSRFSPRCRTTFFTQKAKFEIWTFGDAALSECRT